MPIVFPQNSAIGATYDYGGIHYIYNGDGWVNKSIYGVSAGNQISFNNYNGTGPVRIDVVEGIGSGLDADLLQGVSGQRFVENLQTGLLYGGLLQVNAGNSAYFDITSGVGVISTAGASLTAYPVPSFNYVTWGALSGLTVAGITSDEETWISINSAGNVVQQNTKWLDSQFDDSIPLGVLIHPNNASINFAVSIPHVAYGQPSQLDPFVRAFGPIKISGHEISANGANLQVNKSTGSAYLIGRNYSTNPSSPNVVEDTNATPISTIYRYYRDGSGKFTVVTNSSIDPSKYDDGTGTLNAVPGGQYTIQRLFFLPGVPNVLASYYGRELYNSIETAQANIPFEQFNEDDSTASLGVFAGYLIVKGSTTQLNNTSDAKFINSGIFRNLSNIGGGGVAATSLDDLSDVTITSVVTGQVLKYNGGFWENDYVSNLDLVSSFNGKTGAIQGVSAAVAGSGINVSGATGSVTITNTGVLSFNGKTGAIQGVSSINGSTGAITNVAFTNVDNLFSTSQTISGLLATLTVEDTDYPADIQIIPSSGQIKWTDTGGGFDSSLLFGASPSSPNNVATLPNFTTTLAGLTGTQTFTGLNTFSNNLLVNTARLGRTGSNLVFGVNAGGSVTSGTLNTIIGDDSGDLISSGANNTSLGYETLTALTTGVANTAVGMWALRNGTTGSNNTAVGSRALRSNTTGNDNTAIGYYALDLNETGIRNTAIGNFALANGATAASNNVAIGYVALYNNTSGTRNIAVGVDSLRTNTTASNNVGIGYQSLYSATSGGSNTGVGTSTAYRLTTGINNTAIGYQALFGSASVTSQANTAVGYNSMVSNTSGSYNSGIGIASLYSLTSGAQNTAVGTESLYAITNTSNNTAVGQLALRYATQGSDNTAIGILAGAYKTASNTNLTTIGNNNVYIGSEARASGDSVNNEIVIGSKAVGLGASTAVIGATAQSSATIYGVMNLPGGLSASGGITFNSNIRINNKAILGSAALGAATPGCIEFDGDVLYAGTTAGRGVVSTQQISVMTAATKSLLNATGDQNIFDTPQDVITLAANTTYQIEGYILLSTGTTTTRNLSLKFTEGIVANAPTIHFATIGVPTTGGAAVRSQDTAFFNTTSGGVITQTTFITNSYNVFIRGLIKTVDSVTITPQIAFSAAPGGTNTVNFGTYISFIPIGNGSMASVGPWA
jgi:hypothetical protein